MGANFRWRNKSQFDTAMRKFGEAANQRPLQIVQRYAAVTEGEAKRNAGWTDRTANARQGLSGQWEPMGDGQARLVLATLMEYGKWLELRHAGRYAIIMRTLEANHAPIMRDARG